MATIWFLKAGERQRGPAAAQKSLDWCVVNLGPEVGNWIKPLDTKNLTIGEKENPRRAPYRGFRYAVVQVDEVDVQDKTGWEIGFYLLEKNATQVRTILEGSR